jgi:hypothetical protein
VHNRKRFRKPKIPLNATKGPNLILKAHYLSWTRSVTRAGKKKENLSAKLANRFCMQSRSTKSIVKVVCGTKNSFRNLKRNSSTSYHSRLKTEQSDDPCLKVNLIRELNSIIALKTTPPTFRIKTKP